MLVMLFWNWTFVLTCDSSYILNTRTVHLVTLSPEVHLSPRFPAAGGLQFPGQRLQQQQARWRCMADGLVSSGLMLHTDKQNGLAWVELATSPRVQAESMNIGSMHDQTCMERR